MQNIIENKLDELKKLCKTLKIKRMYAFGSVVSDDNFNKNSDIDFLISFIDNITIEEYTDNYFHYIIN